MKALVEQHDNLQSAIEHVKKAIAFVREAEAAGGVTFDYVGVMARLALVHHNLEHDVERIDQEIRSVAH